MLTRMECFKIPAICQVIHYIEKGVIKKSYHEFAYELLQVIYR